MKELSSHKNVLPFLGYTISPFCSVYPIAHGGTIAKQLSNYLIRLRIYDDLKSESEFEEFVLKLEQKCLELLKMAASGLVHLHDHGIVHGSVKVDNMVCINETVKICDYGMSSLLDRSGLNDVIESVKQTAKNPKFNIGDEITREEYQAEIFSSFEFTDTTRYFTLFAPESVEKGVFTKESDVFCFASCVWQLLNGIFPFLNNCISLGTDKYINIDGSAKAFLSERILSVIDRSWGLNPKDRPTMKELHDAL